MFIDIHVHTTRKPGPLFDGKPAYLAPEQLLRLYDRLEIERGCLMVGVSPECARQPQSNEEALEIAAASGGRLIPFCNVDPRALKNAADAPLGDVLRHYRDQGCKGIGEVTANLPFLHPLVQNLFRHAEEVGLPLTFHIAPQLGGIYGLYDEPGLPQLERSLANFPRLKFFGHSQPFWAEIAKLEKPADRYGYPSYPVREEGVVPKLMRQYPNLYGDLSARSGYNALARDPEYAARFLTEFQDRLLFGTDIVQGGDDVQRLGAFLKEMLDKGKISEEVFSKVARKNAIRILGLDK
ncbi:MAG: amidohydrolase family protein [Kiritimatiellae bacterium]|nr:amidohydrolase family protein [Kiritimatiellia bacterium]